MRENRLRDSVPLLHYCDHHLENYIQLWGPQYLKGRKEPVRVGPEEGRENDQSARISLLWKNAEVAGIV